MTVSVEEEYGSKLKSSRVKEPYIGTGVIKAITAPYYAWMDFVVENKYGKITYTIELAPNGIVNPASLQSSSNYNHKSSVNLKEIENNLYDCYEVYDFKGLKIKTCSSKDELKNLKGFFVVKCYSQGIYYYQDYEVFSDTSIHNQFDISFWEYYCCLFRKLNFRIYISRWIILWF